MNMLKARKQMVEWQLRRRGIAYAAVLKAMETVPRHLFVDESYQDTAYDDGPLPIGHGQTISQPYIVGFMTEMLEVEPHHRILEIGSGCGYQATILSRLAEQVVTLEVIPELAENTAKRLRFLGYDNIDVHCVDGYQGWPELAPYDRIIGTAAPSDVPDALTEQLAKNGRMILPVGSHLMNQYLRIITKDEGGSLHTRRSLGVRFVPMVHDPETK